MGVSKSTITLTLKIVVSVVLLAVMASRIDIGKATQTMLSADPGRLILSVAIVLAVIALGAVRWKLISDAENPSLALPIATRVMFIGWFFNQALPSTVGGDVVRGHLLWHDHHDKARFVNAIVIDRLIGLFVILILVTALLPRTIEIIGDGPQGKAVIALTIIGYICYALALSADIVLARLTPFPALARMLQGFSKSFRRIVASPALFAKILIVALAYQLAWLYAIYLVFDAVGAGATIVDVLVLMPAIQLITSLPITYAGWGLREQSVVFAFALVGVGAPEALAASILMGLSWIVAGLPGAILWVRFRRTLAPREA